MNFMNSLNPRKGIKKSFNHDQKQSSSLNNLVRKNIKYSLILKIFSVLLSFYSVRLAFTFIGSQNIYGIWLTVISVLSWLSLMNGGLNNTLRNKLSESLAASNDEFSKKLISTSYAIMILISMGIAVLLLSMVSLVDFRNFFGAVELSPEIFSGLLYLLILSFLFQLTLNVINSLCFALNYAVIPSLFAFIVSLLNIIIILIFMHFRLKGIIFLGIAHLLSLVTTMLIGSYLLYRFKFRRFIPSFNKVDFKLIPILFTTSIKFFVLEICAVILFSTDTILIANLISASEVASYQLVMKMLSVFTIITGTIITPMWSAVATAYFNNNIVWIKQTLKKLMKYFLPLSLCILLMALSSEKIVSVWIGEPIQIDVKLAILVGVFIMQNIWTNIFAYFLNGIGHISNQMKLMIFAAVLNIPLSYYFVTNLSLGSSGVVLSTIICLMPFSIYGPIEVLTLLKERNKR